MAAQPPDTPTTRRSRADWRLFSLNISSLLGNRNLVIAITSVPAGKLYIATMVNGAAATGSTTMTATLNFLSRITNEVFELQMQRVARKISERQHYFARTA
jgi:hypothetical protein